MPSMREMEVQAKALAGIIKSALAPLQEELEAAKQANAMLREELEELEKRLDEIPAPKDGIDGEKGDNGSDGQDGAQGPAGMSAYDIAVERGFDGTVDDWLSSLKGVDGKDGVDGSDGKDGIDGERGDKGEPGSDGVGVSETLIDRDGELIVTLTNGETKRVGLVVGRDGRDGVDGQKGDPGDQGDPGRDGVDGRRGEQGIQGEKGDPGIQGDKGLPGMDGKDGLGFDDMRVEYDGERGMTLVFERGEDVHEYNLTIPALIDKGVWKAGEYAKGDVVTQGGSLWIAKRDTMEKPGYDNDDWRLSVKRGRDGKTPKQTNGDES